MLKSTLAFMTGTLAAVSVASAADLPARMAPPPAPILAPIFTWTGYYIGANVGAAFGGRDHTTTFFPLNSITGSGGTNGSLSLNGHKNDDVSFTGGGQIGYNYQFGPGPTGMVVGLEADAQYLSFGSRSASGTTNYTFTAATPFGVPATGLAFADPKASVVRKGATDIGYFGTVRGRVGYAFNQYLLYATGGFAYGGGDTDIGYTAGAGLEYAISRNLSMKVEGLYVSLDSKPKGAGTAVYNVATNVLTLTDRKRSEEFGVARVGLNYRF